LHSTSPGVQAKNGISQPFDKKTSGYVRGEACSVIFLQKSDQARRVYATILNSKTNNDGFKVEGRAFPSVQVQKELYEQTFNEIKISPKDVDFFECHATSTRAGDKVELTSIDEFFCVDRESPLKVGSVKGNTAHTEAASGAVSMTKAILMFENEKIIPNINITEFRDDIPALTEGRIEVLRDVQEFDGKIICVNSFGILGSNSHTVMKRNEKVKIDGGFPSDKLPRLLLWAGRTVEAVDFIFDQVASKPIDDEFLALLQCSQIKSFPTTLERGFAIFKSNPEDRSTICVERHVTPLKNSNRPIVFVYAGVGSQWLEMGRDLLKIPLIADRVGKCHDILMNRGIDLKNILTSTCLNTFNNCLNIFVGVTAIQIALTDLLYSVGIEPNFIIGHSVGELGCAYADGTLTLEQTILMAYSRGVAILEGVKEKGLMAAVAMEYDALEKILPEGVEIACHNAEESCTITGPEEAVKNFVKDLKSKSVICKIVDSSGVALHSSLIAECGKLYSEKIAKIIINPKRRSSKWISTSMENEEEDLNSSINYHVNNMIGKVRFADGLKKLPENSLMIEIAPHGILQPILKQSHPNSVCESLTKRNAEDGVDFLLSSLGKIYQNGVNMNIREIYPKIEFPVSRGTPMISHLIKWQHSESFAVPMFDPFSRYEKRNLIIDFNSLEYSYLKDHEIDGKI
jgi:fatty acid synthase, animal type